MSAAKEQKLVKFLDVGSYLFLALSVICVPLLLDKGIINTYVLSKLYVFGGLVLLAILFWAGKIALESRLVYRQSALDWLVAVLAVGGLLSAIFSSAARDSWLGRNEYFTFNFILLASLVLFYFCLTNIINTAKRWSWMVDLLILVGGVSAVIFIGISIFHWGILARLLPGAFNTIDAISAPFGLWMLVIWVLTAGRLVKSGAPLGGRGVSLAKLIGLVVVMALALVVFGLLNFTIIWWLFALSIILLLILGISFINEARIWWLAVLFGLLLATTTYLIIGFPSYLRSQVPVEVSLNTRASAVLTVKTMLAGPKNFLLGSGLGTFGVDFSRWRDINFNSDPVIWALRFDRPVGSWWGILAEGGAVLGLGVLLLIVFVVKNGLSVWLKFKLPAGRRNKLAGSLTVGDDSLYNSLLMGCAWFLATVGMAVVFYGVVLWWLWWLLLALAVVGWSFSNPELIKVRILAINHTPKHKLISYFIFITVMFVIIFVGERGLRYYAAEAKYAGALRAATLPAAESNLLTALSFRDGVDMYHVSLARVYLLQAIELSQQAKPDLNKISSLISQAVSQSRRATALSPKSVAIWENLALMYENAGALVPEGRDWAIKTLEEAQKLEPTNPVLIWRMGNIYALSSKWNESIDKYSQAIKLKPGYLNAYLGLASVYERTGETDKEIGVFQTILPMANNNIDILFNYGRVLYNRNGKGDRDAAEQLWLAAIRLQPNYSNALYSLGLLYDGRSEKSKAVEYYNKVKQLNPENKDVSNKINNLLNVDSHYE